MTVSLRRLPYRSVTEESSRAASTDPAIDRIGVIPLPAAISTCLAGPVQVGGERAGRRLDLDDVAGPDLVHQPAGHGPARNLAHADARRPARAEQME